MRIFNNSKGILTVLFCILASNMASAGILWEKELVLDANTNSAQLASCLNSNASGVIVTTIECPKGSFPLKGDNILWNIEADGNATRILPKNIEGGKVWTNANPAPIGHGCAIASDSLGNLLTVGILTKQKSEKGQKVAVVSMPGTAEKTMSPLNSIESHSIKKMIPLQDNTFVIVGDKSSDGLFLQIDNQGKILQEKLFDMGQTEVFSDIEQTKTGDFNLAVAGTSFRVSVNNPAENSAENFIILYDGNHNIVHEDYFASGSPVSVFSPTLLPKVSCLGNGNIVVVYRKENEDPNKTLLSARCYTQELKYLWEREIPISGRLFPFDVVSCNSTDFVVGMGEEELLEFYFFDKNGTEIAHVQYKGMPGGIFLVAGFNLMQVNGKTIAVFNEGTDGNIKEASMKAKVIALD